jgi:hypothetical protein
MDTPENNTFASLQKAGRAASLCSERREMIEVCMHGGTRLRMDGDRGPRAPYDLLLKAMEDVDVWNEDEQQWTGRWLSSARVVKAQNAERSNPGDENRS